ncbi:MAG: thioredoxin family protein, partial [Chitinophagales bacterium]
SFIISAGFIVLSAKIYAQAAPASADEILKEAYKEAAKEKKNVFVMFHASWCIWCHRMDSSMKDASCKSFFESNYVVRHLVVDESKDKKNLENPGADELRNKTGGKDQGIPYWLIYDAKGNLLADSRMRTTGNNSGTPGNNIGCPANAEEVAYFIDVLKKTSKISAGQQADIEKRFRQNEQ